MARERARRTLLATASSALFAGLAGCSSPPTGSTTPTQGGGASLCGEPTTPPQRSDSDGPVLVRDYPDLPDDLSRESAESYATDFEEARQMNRLARRSSTSAYEVKEVFDRQSTLVDEGAIVSFVMSYAWEQESGGRSVSADDTVAVTYFVSHRTVIRREGSTEADPRTPGVGEVVVCRVVE